MRNHAQPVRSRRLLAVVAAAALCPALLSAAAAAAAAGARAPAAGGAWGTAEEVPGTAALNTGENAGISSMSCASAGSCSAGGYYTGRRGHVQVFVVSQQHGTWGRAIEAPGLEALNTGGNAVMASVSCAPAGSCSAGGYYTGRHGHDQAFVVSQHDGTWGTAQEVPGTAALNTGGHAVISSVSCGSAGNCSAGGHYTGRHGHVQAFVVSQHNGTWGTAGEVPGTAALNTGGYAEINSVSCGSAGNCSAGGSYTGRRGHVQAFVVSQHNGTWGTAIEVPGTAALNTGGNAQTTSVSCASAGNCSAGGYLNSSGNGEAFVVSQQNGTWGTAEEVPGTAALNKGGGAAISSVSCASAGNCGAGGYYLNSSGSGEAFVVSQTNGTWGTAEEVPGTAALNKGEFAQIISVSCASAGNCGAGGLYTGRRGDDEAFVVSQQHGTWAKAERVPGTAAPSTGGGAGVNSVSCAPAGNCSAGGSYVKRTGRWQAFVVSQTR